MATSEGGLIMYLLGLPQWAIYLLEGIFIFVGLSSGAVVLTRTGRNPYWVFLTLVPLVNVIAVWYLAFSAWPKPLKKAE